MNPRTASRLASLRHDELTECARRARAAGSRGRRRVPRWTVTWSRMTLAAAGCPGRERSWVIVISVR